MNNPENKETSKEQVKVAYQHRCGYCGSTAAPIPYEQMYGPGTAGWDCCPDCGGV